MLHIYNTLLRKKVPLTTIRPNKMDLYVCGVTVYDRVHIGHARTFTIFDMMVRYFRHLHYEVTFVRNITDIDDKIIDRALANEESWQTLTERYIDAMHQDFDALELLRPDKEPRATEHIETIITLIGRLMDSNAAYLSDNGDVVFSVKKYPAYGALSGQLLDHLQTGKRKAVSDQKNQAEDFVLWKKAKPNEPHWESPWGIGRPGWHIECSAMTEATLGLPFDIHGGGGDLVFPHHENEIAQSCAAHNKGYATHWIHTGMILTHHEKMSKSLNNFVLLHELLSQYDAEVIRFFLLSNHYRSPLSYTTALLEQAFSGLTRLYRALIDAEMEQKHPTTFTHTIQSAVSSLKERFHTALSDDFNTPEAYMVLFEIAKQIHCAKHQDVEYTQALGVLLKELGGILGILKRTATVFLQGTAVSKKDEEWINSLILARDKARFDKNWSTADGIRKTLEGAGICLEDTNTGTVWRKK